MNTINDFIEQLVSIDPIEGSDLYGHYPFQLYAETPDEGNFMSALALGGAVVACYRHARTFIKDKKATKLFMSIDFPAGGTIKTDFIMVFSVVDGVYDAVAIPYDPKTGIAFKQIQSKNNDWIQYILYQFTALVKSL